MDNLTTFKCTCGFDAPSKFALKKHKRVCMFAPQVFNHNGTGGISDRYALANRETKYHRFVGG